MPRLPMFERDDALKRFDDHLADYHNTLLAWVEARVSWGTTVCYQSFNDVAREEQRCKDFAVELLNRIEALEAEVSDLEDELAASRAATTAQQEAL